MVVCIYIVVVVISYVTRDVLMVTHQVVEQPGREGIKGTKDGKCSHLGLWVVCGHG